MNHYNYFISKNGEFFRRSSDASIKGCIEKVNDILKKVATPESHTNLINSKKRCVIINGDLYKVIIQKYDETAGGYRKNKIRA